MKIYKGKKKKKLTFEDRSCQLPTFTCILLLAKIDFMLQFNKKEQTLSFMGNWYSQDVVKCHIVKKQQSLQVDGPVYDVEECVCSREDDP